MYIETMSSMASGFLVYNDHYLTPYLNTPGNVNIGLVIIQLISINLSIFSFKLFKDHMGTVLYTFLKSTVLTVIQVSIACRLCVDLHVEFFYFF